MSVPVSTSFTRSSLESTQGFSISGWKALWLVDKKVKFDVFKTVTIHPQKNNDAAQPKRSRKHRLRVETREGREIFVPSTSLSGKQAFHPGILRRGGEREGDRPNTVGPTT